jgi:endonuclease/exonuclease/phosphatase family metal-dependent hydrolase
VLIRVATYNVRSFRAGVGSAVDALAPRPDVVLVQECGPRRALGRFAGALGMRFVSSHRPFRRVRNAVLFREPPWSLTSFDAPELHRQGRTRPRGFVAAGLRGGTSKVVAVSAHLGLAPRERQAHARELTDALMAWDALVILGADLNEGPEGPAARWISERLYDAFSSMGDGSGLTFPAAEPTARIDFVFVGDGVGIRSAHVPSGRAASQASDHLPVVVEVEISG